LNALLMTPEMSAMRHASSIRRGRGNLVAVRRRAGKLAADNLLIHIGSYSISEVDRPHILVCSPIIS